MKYSIKKLNFYVIAFAVILFSLVVSSCSTPKPLSWEYKTNTHYVQEQLINKAAYIKPFKDERPESNQGSYYISYIPGMPFGWQTYNRPEEKKSHMATADWKFNPSKDFAKALEADLLESKIFTNAKYTESNISDGIVINGTIKKCKYKSKMFTYCASVFGSYLWYLGAPCYSWKNEVEVSLECIDAKTGNILFHKTYEGDFKQVRWVYSSNYKTPDFEFDYILQEIYLKFIDDLKQSRVVKL